MKITIYIVDDEPMAITYLKSLIKQAGSDFQVIGAAHNGAAAIPEIQRLRPSIVFADISMPVMDGLVMSEKVLQMRNPPVVFVLTSYKDFEYVQKGIRLGVRNYILKNDLTEDSLRDLLLKTKQEIQRENRDRHKILEHNIRTFLLSGGDMPEDNPYQSKPLQRYALVHLIEQRRVYVRNSQKQKPLSIDCYDVHHVKLPEGISCNAFAEIYAGEYCGILFLHENCVNGEQKIKLAMQAMIEQFSRECPDCLGLISNITKTFSELPGVYYRTRKLLDYLYMHDAPCMFWEKDMHIQLQKTDSLEEEFKKFISGLEQESLMESQVALDILLERAKANRPIWEYSDTVQNVYRILKKYGNEHKLNPAHTEFQDCYPSVSLLEKRMYQCVDDVLFEMRERRELHYSNYVIEAVKYIQRNYDKDISIADIAEAAKISEGHLRRCFKQEMNVRVVNYLMDCRLERAKQLIQEKSHSMDEIWKQTGFTSAQYFSYVFKQKEGVSPREYAKAIQNR